MQMSKMAGVERMEELHLHHFTPWELKIGTKNVFGQGKNGKSFGQTTISVGTGEWIYAHFEHSKRAMHGYRRPLTTRWSLKFLNECTLQVL